MAVETIIISEEHFTVNGKTVYKKNGSWYANPYLSTVEETETAREIIGQIKRGELVVPAQEPQQLNHV